MKKITSLLICVLVLLTSMCVIASATSTNAKEYNIDGIEYTIEFEDSNISEEKKENIANTLLSDEESDIMPANILCDIFGHDYKYTTVNVIQHKAKTYKPRCLKSTYEVTYCEDCDYTKETLLGRNYVECCPED